MPKIVQLTLQCGSKELLEYTMLPSYRWDDDWFSRHCWCDNLYLKQGTLFREKLRHSDLLFFIPRTWGRSSTLPLFKAAMRFHSIITDEQHTISHFYSDSKGMSHQSYHYYLPPSAAEILCKKNEWTSNRNNYALCNINCKIIAIESCAIKSHIRIIYLLGKLLDQPWWLGVKD